MPSGSTSAIRIRSVAPVALDVPLGRVVATPIAPVGSVVSLLVVVQDEDGVEGWGEVWCNFPRFGIHHRARIVSDVLAPLLAQRAFDSPADAWVHMTASCNALRLQSGETGPIAAAIAGIDIALWDLAGKRTGEPLWRQLGGASQRVPVYASLGRADDAAAGIARCLDQGYRAIKLRSSGAVDQHAATLRRARALAGDDCDLMLDVNGSWEPQAAIATVGQLAEFRLRWLEEPIPVDAPDGSWRRLAAAAPMPLAGGENMLTPAMFDAALAARVLAVLQPDMTKWGGFSGTLPLARRIVAAGLRFCPHLFAGAPGVLASAHLLVASGASDGILEFPVGPNPVREALLGRAPEGGWLALGDAPGLGLEMDLRDLARYRVAV